MDPRIFVRPMFFCADRKECFWHAQEEEEAHKVIFDGSECTTVAASMFQVLVPVFAGQARRNRVCVSTLCKSFGCVMRVSSVHVYHLTVHPGTLFSLACAQNVRSLPFLLQCRQCHIRANRREGVVS
jgi:hypothetical protein